VTPRAGGVVREVIADIGDTVKQGDALAVVDSRELGNAKAAYLAAQSRRALAQATWDREERLYKQEITSEEDFLSAKYALAEADIALSNARQELLTLGLTKDGIRAISSQAEESLSLFDVVAPIAGTIIERRVVLGETVEHTTEVFYIADLSSVCVDLVLTQREAARVQKGSPATIRSTSEDVRGSGTVSYVAPLVDAETRTTTARIVLPNEEELWRPGMSVEGLIHGAETGDTLVVSAGSVQYVEERPCVFVYSDHGFELREVLTGLSDEEHIEVTEGLRPGERIAVQGAFHLKAEFEKLASGGPAGHGHVH
jgi:cobalt-zinc-cadmium efflux system membrane fusion protein